MFKLYLEAIGSHSIGASKSAGGIQKRLCQKEEGFPRYSNKATSLGDKCLGLMPERIAIAMMDQQGWILRNKIKWAKQILIKKENRTIGSVMPTSVKDRFNESGEDLYFFVKNKHYYSNLNAVKLDIQTFENRPQGIIRCREYGYDSKYLNDYSPQSKQSNVRLNYHPQKNNNKDTALGKNLPSIWLIQSEPHNPECDHLWESGLRSGISGGPAGDTTQRHFKESSYSLCSKCGAWLGQLGLEACPEDYIDHLVMIFQECWRVLKPAGALWVVIGDSYAGSGIGTNDYQTPASRSINKTSKPHPKVSVTQRLKSVKAKSLILIPHRFALAMSEAGWIVRNEIIWHKPNSMPESASDRFSRDFEHIYFFTKKPHYYFQQLLEPVTESSLARVRQFVKNGESFDPARHKTDPTHKVQTSMEVLANAAKKLLKYPYRNKRAVWRLSPGGYCQTHFAVFPEALIEPMIQSTCPPAICTKCGHPYRKVLRQINRARVELKENQVEGPLDDMCSCGAETKPGLVVDPFMGSGTTGAVALKLGREFIGFELNPDYVKIAEDRIEKTRHGLQLGLSLIDGLS